MDYILCSRGFRNFVDSLAGDTTQVSEMLALISEGIPYLLDEIPLGKIEVSMDMAGVHGESVTQMQNSELYCSTDGYEEEKRHSNSFVMGDGSSFDVTAYPKRGCLWRQEEEEALSFLAQCIFMLCDRARMSAMIQTVDVTDSLTGVFNMTGLMRHGQGLLAKGRFSEYTACFCNIKNFRYVNQQVGSKHGNQILKKYARGIAKWQKEGECIARLGGDNFCVLIEQERVQKFLEFISGFRVRITFPNGEKEYAILSRVGICEIGAGDSVNDAISGASVALDVARRYSEQDVVWFSPKMLEEAMHKKEISLTFPKALREKEFLVYYQPKVNLQTRELCGCEALVRWMRDGKMVPPMDFIRILEKEGSICNLDFYVFEQVCRDMRKWLDSGLKPVRVSINFSKIHLRNPQLADHILEIIQKYNLDSSYIEVELTEVSGYEDYDALIAFIHAMREHGINTSIDDFGTGYSSLNLLKNLKVDIIKLDKTFLDGIIRNGGEEDEILIKNIVRMIHELGMDIIAEGVETIEQADFLQKVHCSMAQGYLFDRPLPCSEFESRLVRSTYVL